MKKIYLIALIFAVITGIAVYSFASYIQNQANKDLVSVVVALKSIPENTLITVDMLELKKLPAEAVNTLAFKKGLDVQGKVTNTRIEANEQILTTNVNEVGKEGGGLNYTLPKGKRAITVEVNDITGVAGFIKKGNYIDVVASLMFDIGNTKTAKTILLLQNVMVLSTNTSLKDQKAGSYTNITLAVTPDEAVKLFYAQTNGKLTAILRPVLENEIYNVSSYIPVG